MKKWPPEDGRPPIGIWSHEKDQGGGGTNTPPIHGLSIYGPGWDQHRYYQVVRCTTTKYRVFDTIDGAHGTMGAHQTEN